MKKVLIMILTCYAFAGQSQEKSSIVMNDQQNITTTITKVFVHTDQKDWSGVEAQFNNQVLLDYSSMTGADAVTISPNEITTGWKTVLPGFTHTHHQIGNFITTINGNTAHAFCYGTATHYLEDENGNIWTVVGSYDFDLEKIQDTWKITSMKFNYKYQSGNTKLIQKAIENAKNK